MSYALWQVTFAVFFLLPSAHTASIPTSSTPQVFQQSAVSLYLGAESQTASRDRLSRVGGTTASNGRPFCCDRAHGGHQQDLLSRVLQDRFSYDGPRGSGDLRNNGRGLLDAGPEGRGTGDGEVAASGGKLMWAWDRSVRQGLHGEIHRFSSKFVMALNPECIMDTTPFRFAQDELQGTTDALVILVDGMNRWNDPAVQPL